MTTYHVKMTDGQWHTVPDTSAASAMQKALIRNPGLKITECYAGNKGTSGMYEGYVDFEVPAHEAYVEKPAPSNGVLPTASFQRRPSNSWTTFRWSRKRRSHASRRAMRSKSTKGSQQYERSTD